MNLTLQDIGNWELDQGKTNPTVDVICRQKMCLSLTACAQAGQDIRIHGRHCVVSLSKTYLSLLSTGSTQEDLSWHKWKIVDWDV